jgi:hypothetical protein
MKANMFGITKIRVYMTMYIDELNEFLIAHDGDIIDIQCTDEYFHVIYQDLKNEWQEVTTK